MKERTGDARAGPRSTDWMAMEHESASHIRRNPRSFGRATFSSNLFLRACVAIRTRHPLFLPLPFFPHRRSARNTREGPARSQTKRRTRRNLNSITNRIAIEFSRDDPSFAWIQSLFVYQLTILSFPIHPKIQTSNLEENTRAYKLIRTQHRLRN